MTIKLDRILGCLLAGAIGDAIGADFENRSRPEFKLPSSLHITDDTQLSIATCEAIIQTGSADPESIAKRMSEWFVDRRISGIGSSTLKALTELSVGGHWAFVGATGEYSAGNGAANRIAPLAFLLDPDNEIDRRTIRDVCRITHRNDEAYVGALAVIHTIANSAENELIEMLTHKLPDSAFRDRLVEVHSDRLTARQLTDRHPATGYVVNSVPLSILSFNECRDYLETIQFIIECGGDTDTVAAIFGNIYGSANGTSRLPMDLARQIPEYDLIREIASKFAKLN